MKSYSLRETTKHSEFLKFSFVLKFPHWSVDKMEVRCIKQEDLK